MPESVSRIEGKAAPFDADDVDTDLIIPAQYLKVTEKKGLGKYLFYSLRYDEAGKPKPGFILERNEFKGSPILIAGKNFGIGSSRENAVWSLLDYGVRCVIASSFGDIFYNNSSKNGLVCIRLPQKAVEDMRQRAHKGVTIAVDLEAQSISFDGKELAFEMESYVRQRLLTGMDDIDITMAGYEGRIRDYEARMPSYRIPKK
jgi:3-isopropylmalate dehydratase small subunit